MNRTRQLDPLRCPRCGSRYTESLRMAFATRKRTDPRADLSEFAESVRPPERRSELLLPGMGGFWTGFLLYIGWHSWGLHVREAWAYTDEPVIQWLLAASFVAGIVVTLIWRMIARDYNRRRWPVEHEAWERQVVCRRCGHRFLPSVDLATSETGR